VKAAVARPQTPPSSSGLGHRVLSPKTGVRLPVGVLLQVALPVLEAAGRA
jgi:hypothetical protein